MAEYPAPNWQGTQALELLQHTQKPIPLIYITHIKHPKLMAKLIAKGAADCIEMGNAGHLPAAVRRVLSDKELRDQRDRAEKKLRHSEARYRAVVGNPSYGMCRWNMEGKLLDADPALVTMLGYASRRELMAQDLTGVIFRDPAIRKQILEGHGAENQVKSKQIDWKRRDGTMLKMRLSGREVQGHRGKIEGRLKQINDRYGHLTGNRALCRMADALSVTCREIDTVARFGGDEFAVVLPETGAEPSRFAAQRICSTLVEDGGDPQLSASVGTAIYPQDGQTIESLLSAADVSLYAMKSEAHRGALQPQSSEKGHHRDRPKVLSTPSLAAGRYAPK